MLEKSGCDRRLSGMNPWINASLNAAAVPLSKALAFICKLVTLSFYSIQVALQNYFLVGE